MRVVAGGSNGPVPEEAADTGGLEWLSGPRAVAFSGIARNHEFRRMLEALGCHLVDTAGFPDHHWYTPNDFKALLSQVSKSKADMLITTDKDYAGFTIRSSGRWTLWSWGSGSPLWARGKPLPDFYRPSGKG